MTTLSQVEYHANQLLDGEAEMYAPEVYSATSYHGNDFHASSYVDCGRKQISELLHYEPAPGKFVVQWKRDAEMGKVVHTYMQQLARARGQIARTLVGNRLMLEIKLKDIVSPEMLALMKKLHFQGTLDGMLATKGSDWWVWEIKSISEEYFGKNKKYLAGKLAHYESQVQMYMHFTEVHQGIILVVSRQKFLDLLMGRTGITWEECYQEYEVTYDPLFVGPELERLERLAAHLEAKTLPEGEPHREGVSCRFCEYPCPLKVGK